MKAFDPLLLKDAIGKSGLSIDDIAQSAGLSSDCIYKLLRGDRKNPAVSTIISIASALQKTFDDFFVDIEFPIANNSTSEEC